MSILRTEGLKKYYGKGNSLVKALDGVKVDKDHIMKIMYILGLTEKVHSLLGQLSGGQQQDFEMELQLELLLLRRFYLLPYLRLPLE